MSIEPKNEPKEPKEPREEEEPLPIRLRKGEERRLRAGHLWVFSNEVEGKPGKIEPGAEVVLLPHRGRPLGYGYANPASLILARLVSRRKRLTRQLFGERIARAAALRRLTCGEEEAFRAVHGEGDYLPGLVVDRYGDYLALQPLAAGIDKRLDWVIDGLEETFSPKGILLRGDGPARKLEGLESRVEVVRGEVPEKVEVSESGLTLVADLFHGQKTGLFLDQRENRRLAARWSKGREVLDLYCHSGGFALTALAAGAKRACLVDSSASALDGARQNARLNGLATLCRFEEADAFGAAFRLAEEKERFGVVVLDPPSLVKSARNLKDGLEAYREINRRAAKLVRPGGLLVTACCSHHVPPERFTRVVAQALKSTGRRARVLAHTGAGPDHPVHPAMAETAYLKCLFVGLD